MKQKTKSWQNDFRILLAGVVANVDDWKSIEALEKFISSLLHQERKRVVKLADKMSKDLKGMDMDITAITVIQDFLSILKKRSKE